jgi:hypothetical protein
MVALLAALICAQADASVAAVSPGAPDASLSVLQPLSANLLRNATVTKNVGAPNVARMADGTAPVDGDAWDTQWTAIFAANGVLEWDLGSLKHLEVLRIQADNNDFYQVATSVDGQTWARVWTGKPVGVPGMQTRTSEPLDVTARFVRLTAEGGDNMYSVGEFEAYETTGAMMSTTLKRITPPPPPAPAPVNTAHLIVVAVAALGAWFLWRARAENLAKRPPPAA